MRIRLLLISVALFGCIAIGSRLGRLAEGMTFPQVSERLENVLLPLVEEYNESGKYFVVRKYVDRTETFYLIFSDGQFIGWQSEQSYTCSKATQRRDKELMQVVC